MNTIQKIIFYKLEQKQMTAREVWAFLDSGFLDEKDFSHDEWKKYFGKKVPRNEAVAPPKEVVPTKRSGGSVKSSDRTKKPSKDGENYAQLFYTLNEELEKHIPKWEKDLQFIDKLYRVLLQKENPSIIAKTKELNDYLIKNTNNDFNSIIKLLKPLDRNPAKRSLNIKDLKIPLEEFKNFYEFDKYKKYLQKQKYKFLIQNYYTSDLLINLSKVQIPLVKRENVAFVDKLIQLQRVFEKIYTFWTSSAKTGKEMGLNTYGLLKNKIEFQFTLEGEFYSIYFKEDGDINGIPILKGEELRYMDREEKQKFKKPIQYLFNENSEDETITELQEEVSNINFQLNLKRQRKINGINFEKGEVVLFDQNFYIKSFILTNPKKIYDFEIYPKQFLLFNENFNIKAFTLLKRKKIFFDNLFIPSNSLIYYNTKNQIKYLYISIPIKIKISNRDISWDYIMTNPLKSWDKIIIDYEKNVVRVEISKKGSCPVEDNKKEFIFQKGDEIFIDKQGFVKSLIVCCSRNIGGVEIQPGNQLLFEDNYILVDVRNIVVLHSIQGEVTIPKYSKIYIRSSQLKKVILSDNIFLSGMVFKKDATIYHSEYIPSNGKINFGTIICNEVIFAGCNITINNQKLRVHIVDEYEVIVKLEKETYINGMKFSTEEYVMFFTTHNNKNERHFYGGELAEATFLRGLWFCDLIWFYENGEISAGYLEEDSIINGILISNNHQINFHANGLFLSGKLKKPCNINGVSIPENVEVCFGEDGVLESMQLEKEEVFNDIAFTEYSNITVYPNGKIKEGKIAKDTFINNIKYKAGTEIYFNEDGTVKEVEK